MRLRRTHFNADGILGALYDDEGYQVAATLEHSYDGRPKLPAGTYRCQRGQHVLHSSPEAFETFEVMGVPDHSGILFHVGNRNADSQGCVLLGRVCTSDAEGCLVTASRATFARFMLDLAGVESFTLTVEDGATA